MPLKRIFIKKSAAEWEALQDIVATKNKKDVSAYLRSEVPKFINHFDHAPNDFPGATGKRMERPVCVTEENYKSLERIAKIMSKPVAAVVNEYLLTPLLHR